MVMSLRNRKGDVTITTVILIVLGLVVLVMLILGFTKGTGFFFDLFDKGPSDLQAIAKACVGYVEASLGIDYCKYRELKNNGQDELVNCNDARIEAALTVDDVTVPSTLKTCAGDEQNRQTACAQFSAAKQPNVVINGGSSCAGVSGITTSVTTLADVLEGGPTKEFTFSLSSVPSRTGELLVTISGDVNLKIESVTTGTQDSANVNVWKVPLTASNPLGDVVVRVKAETETGTVDTSNGRATITISGEGYAQKTVTIVEKDSAAPAGS